MPDQFVDARSTTKLGRVEGDLSVGHNATIRAESGGKVSVTGRVSLEGPVTIDCDFNCQSMRVEGKGFGPSGDIRVNGDLVVEGSADIDASIKVSGSVRAGDLDIGGHLRTGQVSTHRLRVGGHLEVRGTLEAEEVDVGGQMTVIEEVKINNLRVGGHAKLGGGSITGDIRVRGHFSTTRKLAFGRLQVYGNMVLPAGSAGEKLSTLGRVEFDGDAFCKELEVTGSARVRGVLSAESFDLKGNLRALEGPHVSKRFQVWGAADVTGPLECETLGVGGRLVAESVSATNRTDIGGEVRTSRGLKSKSVVVGKGSKVTGPIFAMKVEIGSDTDLGSMWGLPWWRGALGRLTTVEDIHGGDVKIRQHCRVGRVFAKTVELGEGSTAEEIVYTGEVKLPQKYFLTKPLRRVDSLPEPSW